jgi:hypothetical protein
MKPGLPVSIGLHTALLAFAIISIPGVKPAESPPSDPIDVEFVETGDITQLRLGQKTGKPSDEITPKDTAKAAKESEGKRAGTSKQEEPPPPPPKPQQVAALPEPPPPLLKPEPPKPPEVKPEPPKDVKALDKVLDEAEKEVPKKPEPPKVEPVKEPPKPEPPKPEPQKAEAKPVPKPPEKKPEPPKPPVQAAKAPSESKEFSRDISDILNRNRTGTAASAEAKTASLGSTSGVNAKIRMTQNETDAFIAQVRKCWNPPPGASEANIVVALRIRLNQDGSVQGRPTVGGQTAPLHPLGPAVAQSAIRAVILCAPYTMPADKYAVWQDFIGDFDPKTL